VCGLCCNVLQCVAVCWSVLQCVLGLGFRYSFPTSLLSQKYIAVCCNVSQCVVVCCGVLQCVVVLFLATAPEMITCRGKECGCDPESTDSVFRV